VKAHFNQQSLARLAFSDTTNRLDMPIHAIWPSYKPLSQSLKFLIEFWAKQIQIE
jgi:hypothetical protein